MNRQVFFSKYGLNHNKINNLILKYGISDFNASFKNKNLEEVLNKFLDLNLDKKEIILKRNHLIYIKQLESGSIRGYKRLRGLPSHNQRTKTNSKTNRSKK
jgi:ribosomal protein S13